MTAFLSVFFIVSIEMDVANPVKKKKVCQIHVVMFQSLPGGKGGSVCQDQTTVSVAKPVT